METALSVFRNEKKYLLTQEETLLVRSRLDKILTRDVHSGTKGYIVRSLYFDSVNNIDYMTKLAGTQIRKKIRLRIYSTDADKCKLEVKNKNGDLQHKVSVWLDRADAKELIKCNYSVLVKYFETSPDAVDIYKMMVLGVYRPVVLVEYDRIAYTYPLFNTRITIDMNIRSSESNMDLFCEKPMYNMIMNDMNVLEVKYNEKLMDFISKTLMQFELVNISSSKYCMGRKVFCDFEF